MYKDTTCDKCGTPIIVIDHDRSERFYCSPCAMAKFSSSEDIDVSVSIGMAGRRVW